MLELLLAAAVIATHINPAWANPRALFVAAAQISSIEEPIEIRLERVTAPLLGVKFGVSPLGEGTGPGPDKDPRIRFDRFDCTTFVETALALARTDKPWAVLDELDSIRYRGGPEYLNRRHFPEAEWIPELIGLRILEDSTPQLGHGVIVRTRHYGHDWWSEKGYLALLGLPKTRAPQGDYSLAVWPIEEAIRDSVQIPTGSIINVIRDDDGKAPVLVAHQGLVLMVDSQKVVRHAAYPPAGAVIDEPIARFLTRITHLKTYRVAGVNVLRVVERGAASKGGR